MRLLPLLAGLLPLAAMAPAAPVTWSSLAALPRPEPALSFAYGPAASQRVELHRPEGVAVGAPLAVLVHGGCWLDAYDLAYLRPLAGELAARGWLVANVEYRRLGEEGAGLPGTPADVAAAVAAVLAHPALEGAAGGPVVIAGHSAGGHLALLAAAGEPRLDGVVGLAAICDLAAYAAEPSGGCPEAARRLVASGPTDGHDPALLPAPRARVVLVTGALDPIVPGSQATAYAASRPAVEQVAVEGAGHFDLVHPGTAAFERVIAVFEGFRAAGRDQSNRTDRSDRTDRADPQAMRP